jgi:hypothetical protein
MIISLPIDDIQVWRILELPSQYTTQMKYSNTRADLKFYKNNYNNSEKKYQKHKKEKTWRKRRNLGNLIRSIKSEIRKRKRKLISKYSVIKEVFNNRVQDISNRG